MTAAYDVVMVGGGIVGAACALECARSGLRVLVVEGSIIGGGATAAGMGHLVVMDDSEAQFALTHYSRNLWDELAIRPVPVRMPEPPVHELVPVLEVDAQQERWLQSARKLALSRGGWVRRSRA